MPVVLATWEARQENCLNLGDGGCSELRSCLLHSSLGNRARLCLKKRKNDNDTLLIAKSFTESIMTMAIWNRSQCYLMEKGKSELDTTHVSPLERCRTFWMMP